MYRHCRAVRLALVVCLVSLASSIGVAVSTPAFAGTDDYPTPWRAPAAQDSVFDTWGEYNRECTSFVAWRLHSRNGFEMPFYDNATGWGPDATSRGYQVNMTPAVGAVAWWSGNARPPLGHVAWVEAVNGATVTIEQYNADNHGNYSEQTISTSSVSGYIHFKDLLSEPTVGIARKSDVVVHNLDNSWVVALSTGSSFSGIGAGLSGWGKGDWTGLADVTGDGRADIVLHNPGNNTFSVAVADGSGHFGAPGTGTWLTGWGSGDWVGLADINGQ